MVGQLNILGRRSEQGPRLTAAFNLNQEMALVGSYEKKATGPIKFITFARTEDGMMILQKGILTNGGVVEVVLVKDAEAVPIISVVSYGPLGGKPKLEFGPEFEGAEKRFSFWARQKLFKRA